jgi:hypothetical protein
MTWICLRVQPQGETGYRSLMLLMWEGKWAEYMFVFFKKKHGDWVSVTALVSPVDMSSPHGLLCAMVTKENCCPFPAILSCP